MAATTRAPAGPVFQDDFRAGFRNADEGTSADWDTQPVGDLPQGDGIAAASADGLTVKPTGVNPETGLPAFSATTAMQSAGGQGTRDHVKWTAMPRRVASTGIPGFDAPEDGELVLTTVLSARTHGVGAHPFGDAVTDPQSDPRLGCGSMVAADLETAAIFGFFVTNTRIYVNYERLRLPGTDYAAYTYAVPVADRTPEETETLRITLDRSQGSVTWNVNGQDVLTIDRIGHRALDRKFMLLDHGGTEEHLHPRQLISGVGMFTLLDGAMGEDGTGLVRIDSNAGHYVDPRSGGPAPQKFTDDAGLPSSRLWGQGVELNVRLVDVVTH